MDQRLRYLERHRHDSINDEAAYLRHLLRAGSREDIERISLSLALGDRAAEMIEVDLPDNEEIRNLYYQFGFTKSLFYEGAWYAYNQDLLSQKDFATMSICAIERFLPYCSDCEKVIQLLNLLRDVLRQRSFLSARGAEGQIYEENVDSIATDDANDGIIEAARMAALQAIARPDPPAWFLACCEVVREAFGALPWSTEPSGLLDLFASTPELEWQRNLLVNYLLDRVNKDSF
jgi:hypothetical protein